MTDQQTQDRRAWLRANLPTVAGVVDEFAAAFGRENVRVCFAKEGAHRVGQQYHLDSVPK